MQHIINGFPFINYFKESFDNKEMQQRSFEWWQWMETRRSVRHFSSKPVPKEVIENIIRAASSAPSGAHKQPWTFCVVSDPALKRQIRAAAEQEEYQSYHNRMSEEWLQDLAPLQTDWTKEFLETAPYLVVVFKKSYELKDERKHSVYYAQESCGIACGFLLAGIHHAGLAALTHTPSPMNFLCEILNRPANEKPYLLIPVGYVGEDCVVPAIARKGLNEVSEWYEETKTESHD